MRTFTVWRHEKHAERAYERAVFVADGFSLWAALFAPLWLLRNGMILVFAAYIAAGAAFNVGAAPFIGETAALAVSLLAALWFGLEARALRRWSLSRRGWQLVGLVNARNLADAEARFYGSDSDASASPSPAPPPAPYLATDTGTPLGIFPEPGR